MADQIIQVNSGSGPKIDVSELTVGANTVERQRVNFADPTSATAIAAVSAKGTQGAFAIAAQDLKDSGRNVTNFFMPLAIITTATDTLASLTGFKAGATVTATTTPAVVTTGKTYRITSINMTYIGIATLGSARATLRANPSGVVAIGSPAVATWIVGAAVATAGATYTVSLNIPDGLEFAAGTGIGVLW